MFLSDAGKNEVIGTIAILVLIVFVIAAMVIFKEAIWAG